VTFTILSAEGKATKKLLVDKIPVQFVPGDSGELPTFQEAIPNEHNITTSDGDGLPAYEIGHQLERVCV